MITDINLRRLRNAEYLQFMTDVLRVVHTYPQNALESDEHIGTLSILVAELQILVNNDPTSPLSNDIVGLDAARDRLITGLVKLCDAYSYGPDPDKRAAADTLNDSFAKYGAGIAYQNHQAESATITNLLAEWSTRPDLTAAAELIGAEEWVTAMHAANENFKATYLQHSHGTTVDLSADTVKDKRAETTEAWYKLRDRLDSFFTIHEGEAPWSTSIAHINALVDQYNAAHGSEAS